MFIALFSRAVGMHTGWDRVLTPALIGHITHRLRNIKWAVIRLAARIQAGRYRRRPFAPRPGAAGRRPANPLPHGKNWLEPMMPEVVQYRGHLDHLLRDPEMVALITAAPEALGRPLRSLCRLLGLPPPPILAKPPRAAPAAKPPASPASPPEPPQPQPPRPQPPAWMPRRTRWTLARIRGSPKTA
jgi:hypothetical protein